MDDEKALAIAMHDSLCNWNHIDVCGWYYEIHQGMDDWSMWSHEQYLMRAKTFIKLANEAGIAISQTELVFLVRLIKQSGLF